MKTVSQRLREHILNGAMSLQELQKSEWSELFEQLMRNRLVMGAFRYGRLGAEGKSQFDRVEYMERCLQKYKETGNLECLVDIANLALVEFVEGKHPQRHFHTEEDGKEHAQVKRDWKGWDGKCVLCGGEGPFGENEEVCTWCRKEVPIAERIVETARKIREEGTERLLREHRMKR